MASVFNLCGKSRNLTIGRRICLAKVYGISKINYISSIMQIPEEYIKQKSSLQLYLERKGR
jgi:hypothetical protein